jgi:Lipocalin-like domain
MVILRERAVLFLFAGLAMNASYDCTSFNNREGDAMNFRNVVGISAAIGLTIPLMMGSAVGQSAMSDKERLVGSWTLVALTVGEGDTQTLPYGPSPKGSMMVDDNGRFSITIVRSDLPKFASNSRMTGTPDENKAIVQGSLAYYGTYTIDEATHLITVKIEGSTFPNFAGDTQIRSLSFSGDEVTYINPTPSNGSGNAKNIYRRIK